MRKIKIVDTLFAHAKYSTDFQQSNYLEWDRTPATPTDDICFYTDTSITKINPTVKRNFAWLLESTAVTGQFYQMIKYNHPLFESVFTYDKDLLDLGKNFKFSPTGGCWIKPEDQQIYDKSKSVSCIMSSKNWSDGHKLRHQILNHAKSVNMFNNGIDFFGEAVGNRISYKLDALKDYMFSITIENNSKDYYFTEKLIDCFRTGTVPIYYGCNSINKFFDERGIIQIRSVEECFDTLNDVLHLWYKKNFKFITENYHIAQQYLMSEDYIWKNYFLTV